MRLLLPLLPLVLAAPAPAPAQAIPELSISQWHSIQGGFVDGLRTLGSWSWGKAEEVVHQATVSGDDGLTIWQQLEADDQFSKLVKVIKFEEKAIKYLDDKDAQITFFAPNNDALTPPHHKDGEHDDEDVQELLASPSIAHLAALLERDPSLTAAKSHDDDDDKKKRRKEIFKKIAGKVLQYHGLTKAYTGAELAQNSTVATALKASDGSYGGLHRRIKITKTVVPPALKINFYAKVVDADIKARNGYYHVINHPLIPPGSILDELFLFPDTFSTLTSSVQKVHGAHFLDWHYDRNASSPGKPKFHGTGLATIFAPNNVAFGLLPPRLKFFLFSPFGERALRKVLAYHYIPDTLLLSEVLYIDKKDKHGLSDEIEAVDYFTLADDPSFHKELEIGTALPNATIKVVIDKTKVLPIEGAVKTTIKVNDQTVEVVDVPARNGASHVIGKLLVPPHKHHDHDGVDISAQDSWENWEAWLPAWAALE